MAKALSDPRSRAWVADLLVAAGVVAVFVRGVTFPLLTTWDDKRFLIDDPLVQHISGASFVGIWSKPHFQAFHPLHLMSYWLDVPWSGPNGPVQHAVSLALFVLALLVVRRVFVALGLPLLVATFATLVCALHPAQVEAVTWATGRKEILVLGFASLSVLCHLRAEGRWDRYAAFSLLFFVLAALSKTTVLPLPLVLVLADALLRDVPWKKALLRQAPALALSVGLGVVVVGIWHAEQMIRPIGGGVLGRVALVAATITHYLATIFWPAHPSPLYPIHDSGSFGPVVWTGPLVLVVAILLAWRLHARRALFAILACLVLIAPVLNVVPLYWQVQDRYLSLPMFAVAFGFGAALDALLVSRKGDSVRATALASWPVWLVATALVAALGVRTVLYEGAWASDGALWSYAVAAHPDASYAWLKLGEYRRDAGELTRAIAADQRAVDLEPRRRIAHDALFYATALLDERRHHIAPSEAADLTKRYIAALNDAEALRLLGGDMVVAGYRDAVQVVLDRTFDLSPVNDGQLERAGMIQLRSGNRWLARYYVRRMSRPPIAPPLQALVAPDNGKKPHMRVPKIPGHRTLAIPLGTKGGASP